MVNRACRNPVVPQRGARSGLRRTLLCACRACPPAGRGQAASRQVRTVQTESSRQRRSWRTDVPQAWRCRRSGNECWGPARGQGRAHKGGNGGRYCGLQCVCQRLWMVRRSVFVWRWGAEMQARRAVQRVVVAVHRATIFVTQHHQFDAAAGGADQLHGLGVNQGRCNGHTHRQHQPRQDQAGQQ